MKKVAVLVFIATGIVVGVVSTSTSCGGPPDKTCFADRVNAYGVGDDAGPNRECTTCLQTKSAPKACCDAVGVCDGDPKCVDSFKAAHLCVADGGPSEESRCKGLLANDHAKSLYSCMRSNCGPECGIPSCDLDPAVILFSTPSCDGCLGGACCEKINTCYADRRCKLVVECITTHCPRTLGPTMTRLGEAPAEARRAAVDAVCTGSGSFDESFVNPCIARCLSDFTPGGDAGTTDDQAARCLAFGVFACGAEGKCGPRCVRPDAGPYSGDDAWAEDSL